MRQMQIHDWVVNAATSLSLTFTGLYHCSLFSQTRFLLMVNLNILCWMREILLHYYSSDHISLDSLIQ